MKEAERIVTPPKRKRYTPEQAKHLMNEARLKGKVLYYLPDRTLRTKEELPPSLKRKRVKSKYRPQDGSRIDG